MISGDLYWSKSSTILFITGFIKHLPLVAFSATYSRKYWYILGILDWVPGVSKTFLWNHCEGWKSLECNSWPIYFHSTVLIFQVQIVLLVAWLEINAVFSKYQGAALCYRYTKRNCTNPTAHLAGPSYPKGLLLSVWFEPLTWELKEVIVKPRKRDLILTVWVWGDVVLFLFLCFLFSWFVVLFLFFNLRVC